MPRRSSLVLPAVLVAAALLLVACGSGDDNSSTFAGVSGRNCGSVMFGGDGSPDALIVSDLPLQGDSKERSSQMNLAIEQVLGDADWQAGDQKIGFQTCDDSIAKTGRWDAQVCKDNAAAYGKTPEVIGVIGTYNSDCAALMMPILNQAPGGEVAMVSPANTQICLTEPTRYCDPGEPDSLYPSGTRNYARVVPNDAFQTAGLVTFARQRGYQRLAVIHAAGDGTSFGQADSINNAAGPAGLKIVSPKPNLAWNPDAKSYTGLMGQLAATNPDAVVMAGLTDDNVGQLIKDKVRVMGPNDGDVALLALDGFVAQSTLDEAGSAANGMLASIAGRAPKLLPAAGRQLVESLAERTDGQPVEFNAPYAGQAAAVILEAIDGAGLDRAAVTRSVFGMKVTDGITGDFKITDSGDPDVGPVTITRAGKTFKPVDVVVPPSSLVIAARGPGAGAD